VTWREDVLYSTNVLNIFFLAIVLEDLGEWLCWVTAAVMCTPIYQHHVAACLYQGGLSCIILDQILVTSIVLKMIFWLIHLKKIKVYIVGGSCIME
jgi:hypothetical protein